MSTVIKIDKPAAIDELDGLDGEHSGDQVVGAVPASGGAHLFDEVFARATHKHESAGAEEAEQPAAHELVAADGQVVGAVRHQLERGAGEAGQAVVAAGCRARAQAQLANLVRATQL